MLKMDRCQDTTGDCFTTLHRDQEREWKKWVSIYTGNGKCINGFYTHFSGPGPAVPFPGPGLSFVQCEGAIRTR